MATMDVNPENVAAFKALPLAERGTLLLRASFAGFADVQGFLNARTGGVVLSAAQMDAVHKARAEYRGVQAHFSAELTEKAFVECALEQAGVEIPSEALDKVLAADPHAMDADNFGRASAGVDPARDEKLRAAVAKARGDFNAGKIGARFSISLLDYAEASAHLAGIETTHAEVEKILAALKD